MKKKHKQKQAVVIIHGIGNQFPMDTAREFVENIKEDKDILYSSPDREANFFETRRLSLSNKKTDFFEFYWANLVTEPSSSALVEWLRVLLFVRKPSARARTLVIKVRIFAFALLVLFTAILASDIYKSSKDGFSAWNTGIFTILTFLTSRFFYRELILRLQKLLGMRYVI